MPVLEEFETFLKEKGLKMTRERLALYEGVLEQKGHFNVDILVQRLKENGYKISRDTVYRNLPVFLESGILRQSFRTSRDTIYELAAGKPHHDHMLCRKCGRITEFVDPSIEKIQETVAQKNGFKLEYHCHQLVGVCSACQKS